MRRALSTYGWQRMCASLFAFVAVFTLALGPLVVVYELFDGGDVDVGIVRSMGFLVAAGSAIWWWGMLSSRPGGYGQDAVALRPWVVPVVPAVSSAPRSGGAAARLKRWQLSGFRLLWSSVGLRSEFNVDGRGIGWVRAALEVTRHTLLESLTPTVTVREGEEHYAFRCPGHPEFVRAYTMLEREEGTVEWLRQEVRPGDVVYDIGANIGAFTLLAARRIQSGVVYAFEPHLANATSLLANIRQNELQRTVRVLSCALSDQSGVFGFDYNDPKAGTALSQLTEHSRADESPRINSPELKLTTTVDALVDDGVIRRADVVKIDVDGQELEVLRGMHGLLNGPRRPRAVQVEVNVEERLALCELMRSCGYELAERHYSAGAAKLLEAGRDADEVAFNRIFRPRAG